MLVNRSVSLQVCVVRRTASPIVSVRPVETIEHPLILRFLRTVCGRLPTQPRDCRGKRGHRSMGGACGLWV